MTPLPPVARATMVGAGGALALGGAVSALAYAGAPWWAVAVVASLGVFAGVVVSIVQLVVPQNSRDRLDLWRDLLRYRALRRLPKGQIDELGARSET